MKIIPEFGTKKFLKEPVALSSITIIIITSLNQSISNLVFGQLTNSALQFLENNISLIFGAIFDEFLDKKTGEF